MALEVLIPIVVISVLIISFSTKIIKPHSNIKEFAKVGQNIVKFKKTPKQLIDLRLKTKLNKFVKYNIGKQCYVDNYILLDSQVDKSNQTVYLKIKLFIVKKNSQAWNNVNNSMLLSVAVTPKDIKFNHNLSNPKYIGNTMVPENSNKNCQNDLNPNKLSEIPEDN
tara:strand:- start:637 stop:1134 length:498 start_codon:yes stop_codon:yes gene_type:complete